jgi:hypothetical protein
MRKPKIEASETDARISVGVMRLASASWVTDMKDQEGCRLTRIADRSSAGFENQL